MLEKFLKMIGWYEDETSSPAHEPIPNNQLAQTPSDADIAQCLCIVCENPLAGAIATHSIRWEKNYRRSYFYRVHKSCVSTKEASQAASSKAWDLIDHFGMEVKPSA
jgi:hypothetical protein